MKNKKQNKKEHIRRIDDCIHRIENRIVILNDSLEGLQEAIQVLKQIKSYTVDGIL